jgi:endoglucanase Acf2
MNRLRLIFALQMVSVSVANAASRYNLKLDNAQWVGDKQLRPGDYKLELVGDRAVFTMAKTVTEIPATVVKADKKYSITTYQTSGSRISEIDLGGTNTKLVFGATEPGATTEKK